MKKENSAYLDLCRSAVEWAVKGGASAAEAVITDSDSVKVSVSKREVEQLSASREAGIGIRLVKDQKPVFGSANDLGREAVKALVADLLAKAPYMTPDEFYAIPGKESAPPEGGWAGKTELLSYDEKVASAPVKEKIRRAVAIEAGGLDFSPKVKGAMTCIYQDEAGLFYLANSSGAAGWYPFSSCTAYADMIAEEGAERQSGGIYLNTARYDDLDTREAGREAARRAVSMLGAKPIPSGELPLVVAPSVGAEILGFVAMLLSADSVQKGRSFFAGKTGEKVGSPLLTLIDDGRLKWGVGTAPADGEGIPHQTTTLVAEGVLKGFLYDSCSGKRGKVASTGNRARRSYAGQGGTGQTNFYLKPGSSKKDEVFKRAGKAFYLTSAIGLFAGVSLSSGDFSIPAAGFLVEKGQITSPVQGVSIAGNFLDFLKGVDAVADDLAWFGTEGCPTFSVRSVKIGGGKG